MDKKKLLKMSLLDIMAEYNESEVIIKSYDDAAGTCLCCNHLFDSLEDVCRKFNISSDEISEKLIRVCK